MAAFWKLNHYYIKRDLDVSDTRTVHKCIHTHVNGDAVIAWEFARADNMTVGHGVKAVTPAERDLYEEVFYV